MDGSSDVVRSDEVAAPSLSVVTATFNAAPTLARLIDDLRAQTMRDFVWVVADGNSTDATLSLVEDAAGELRVDLRSEPDFGIYDALNRAVARVTTDYYLVVGADDRLREDALATYLRTLGSARALVDFVAATVEIDGRVMRPGRGMGWLRGLHGEASSHSVGLLIRRELHDRFGAYSRRLPICADQLFFLQCLRGGASVLRTDAVVGTFSSAGTSGRDILGAHTEYLRAQLASGASRWVQLPLHLLRFAKNIFKY